MECSFSGLLILSVPNYFVKGVVVGFMCDGMCKTSLGTILKPMMAIFGLSSQVDQIQAGDYVWSGNTETGEKEKAGVRR